MPRPKILFHADHQASTCCGATTLGALLARQCSGLSSFATTAPLMGMPDFEFSTMVRYVDSIALTLHYSWWLPVESWWLVTSFLAQTA